MRRSISWRAPALSPDGKYVAFLANGDPKRGDFFIDLWLGDGITGKRIKKLVQERARVAEIFAAAVESGMRTLKMDGMEKVMLGLTDLKQVRQVCIK